MKTENIFIITIKRLHIDSFSALNNPQRVDLALNKLTYDRLKCCPPIMRKFIHLIVFQRVDALYYEKVNM